MEEKLKNKPNEKDYSNSNRINERVRTSNQSNNIRSESVNKMLENFSNQNAYIWIKWNLIMIRINYFWIT